MATCFGLALGCWFIPYFQVGCRKKERGQGSFFAWLLLYCQGSGWVGESNIFHKGTDHLPSFPFSEMFRDGLRLGVYASTTVLRCSTAGTFSQLLYLPGFPRGTCLGAYVNLYYQSGRFKCLSREKYACQSRVARRKPSNKYLELDPASPSM